MKVSLNWIKDYVKIPDSLEMAQLAYDLTMSTVEVEDVIDLSKNFNNIVIGEIQEVLDHPNADKLRICRTDIGENEFTDIVCGGINLEKGMKVAVALPGSMVRWHGEGDLVEVKNAKVRGVVSAGMICASSEIGLFDLFPYEDEATILDLSDFDTKAGVPVAQALGLQDIILEIDNKSLTNRPDLWGHYGIAREIAALYNLPLKDIDEFKVPAVSDLKISIEDDTRCPRYIGVKIEGISIKKAPFEMQSRIWRVGMRPINAIVDITNYVMLATGQPTHAFDADNVKGHITVRRALDKEKLILLNSKELLLSKDDLVIADNENSIGLAGVMGGVKDSVLPSTDKIILEIANFEALSIRKTASRYETRTEAAARYEKAIDPERCDIALSLAMELFTELYPEMKILAFSDNYSNRLKRSEIDVSTEWLVKRLGKRIPDAEIADKLKRLGFEITFEGNNMHVVSPTWRSTGDISIPDDIMEEVARMHGLENFEAEPITTWFDGAINQQEIDIDRKIKEYLAFRCGMREVFTYPWMEDEYIKALFDSTENMLSLSTPPAQNERYLRSSLLPNLCKAVAGNLRFFNEFSIFESAQVLMDKDFASPYDPRESLPSQRRNIAGALVSSQENMNSIFRSAKGMIEALPIYAHIEKITFERAQKPVWADDVVWLNIVHNGTNIGNLGLLSKKSALGCGIKNSAVMLFEMDIDLIKPYPSRTNSFRHLPEYPMTDYDISLLFDMGVKWNDIFEDVMNTNTPDDVIQDVLFVDEYKGKQVPEGKKSITFRILIGSKEKTLTSDEIERNANAIIKHLKKSFGAELRG